MKQKLYDYSFSEKKRRENKIVAIISCIVLIFILVSILRNFLIFSVYEKSVSMYPDIPNDSLVMFTPLLINVSRGDVVLLKSRKNSIEPFFSKVINYVYRVFTAQQISFFDQSLMGNQEQIRRVVGMPGDTIYMKGNILFIKPKGETHFLTEFERIEKPYNLNIVAPPNLWDSKIGFGGVFEEKTLGEDEYFVLGDNRASTIDSRLWGVVTIKDIRAKGLFVYFPFSKLRLL